jgi:hypothetical protein
LCHAITLGAHNETDGDAKKEFIGTNNAKLLGATVTGELG